MMKTTDIKDKTALVMKNISNYKNGHFGHIFLLLVYLLLRRIYRLLPKNFRQQHSDRIIANIRYRIEIIKRPRTRHKIIDRADSSQYSAVLYSKTGRTNTITSPLLSCEAEGDRLLSEVTGSVPDVYVYYFKNAEIIGATDAVILGENVLHYELSAIQPKHDLKRPDVFVMRDDRYVDIFIKSRTQSEAKNVLFIHGMKEHSINYYHWITECMPRLITIFKSLETEEGKKIAEGKNIVLLLDQDMPAQCIEALRIAVDTEFSIEFVPRGERLICPEIIYCTPFWLSLDNTRNELDIDEFFMDREAVSIVREAIIAKIGIRQKPSSKIYMRRSRKQMRAIINNQEVEDFISSKGFELVETGGMSFRQQVELFSGACTVVGASGAAFTNLLFMQEGTTAIDFYPSHKTTNYYVFQQLASCSGVKLVHFLTEPGTKEDSVHSDFYVKINHLENKLNTTKGCINE
jgi:hypothetical protein